MKKVTPVSMLKRLFFLLGLSLTLLGLTLSAEKAFATEDPTVMLKGVTDRVMSVLKQNRDALQQNPGQVYGIVNQYIVPYVDFNEMSRWVLGRNAWNNATPAQQQMFVKEFKTLLVNSYAKSLLAFTNQTVEFLPNRNQSTGGRTQVSSVIKGTPRGDIHIDYRLIQSGNGWKVYDILIEGVSLAQGYRAQFADPLQSGGIDAVIRLIQQYNGNVGNSQQARSAVKQSVKQ